MAEKQAQVTRQYTLGIPPSIIKDELSGLYGQNVLADMYNTIQLYQIYDWGAEFVVDTMKDYVPADLRWKSIKAIINKEARFLFSKTPDVWVDVNLGDDAQSKERAKEAASVYQDLVDTVLLQNDFKQALVKAAKDCFISKRVALFFNINVDSGIQISFLPSLEFVYDVDPNNANIITKIVAFYGLNDAKVKNEQRIYKKKYWMENGFAWYSEEIFDGMGNVVETVSEATKTLFQYIPAWVIVNDGLTGDLIGESEVELLLDYEAWYSRMASADLDAERGGMNPIRFTIDAAPESTKGLSIAAGSFWDISSDQNQAQDKSAQVGVLDAPMTYTSALSTTLDRIKNMMYEQCAVPNVSPEALKGVVSSGKTLKAIYWDLIVRCEEKMLAWRPALQRMVQCIIDGARLYPEAARQYLQGEPLPDEPFSIRVDNQYPLPEDEAEEKTVDLAEVAAQTMSKRTYMRKWRNLTDDEAEEELKQIALERQILEDSFSNLPPYGSGGKNENTQKTQETPQEGTSEEEETEEETEEGLIE